MGALKTILIIGLGAGVLYGTYRVVRASSGPRLVFVPTTGAALEKTAFPAGAEVDANISVKNGQVVFAWTLRNTGTSSFYPGATYTIRREHLPAISKSVTYPQLGGGGQGIQVTYAIPIPLDRPTPKLSVDAAITTGGGAGGSISINGLGSVIDRRAVAKEFAAVAGQAGRASQGFQRMLDGRRRPVPDFLTGRGVTVYDK